MAYWRADFDGALATLQQTTERQARATSGSLAQVISTLGCLRASILMTRGETALARVAASDCRASGTPLNKRLADIIEAELAIYAGDPDYARRLTRPMLDELAGERNQVFRWSQIQEVAPLVARLGDLQEAVALLDGALPAANAAGYTAFEADMRITRAEIALAQADPDRAEKELARAEAILPEDYWYDRRRLRTAQAVLQHARGNADAAADEIERVHADAMKLGDVVAELRVHGLIDPAHLAAICSSERHGRLLAQSGMRGASDAWLLGTSGSALPARRAH
jgi:ATP/maltotriose-dependent transcriptional regulator MalT